MGRAAAGVIRAVVPLGRADGLGLSCGQVSCRASREGAALVCCVEGVLEGESEGDYVGVERLAGTDGPGEVPGVTAMSSIRISSSWAPVRSPARWQAVRAMAPGSPKAAANSAAVAANDVTGSSPR